MLKKEDVKECTWLYGNSNCAAVVQVLAQALKMALLRRKCQRGSRVHSLRINVSESVIFN